MQFLRNLLDKAEKPFHKGGKLEKLYPLYEATDTFLYTPPDVTKASSHVRDAIDLKRMMITVVIALLPCVLFAMYNTGFQANYAIAHGAAALANWQTSLFQMLGFGFDPGSILACMLHGAIYFLPVYLVTMIVGGHAEVLFSIVRKHEINEGFLVTGLLFPLILPPTTPLWQAALGLTFGVVVAKEVFGGTGMNFVNPALAARAFLFFAYPAEISGDKVWAAVPEGMAVDGYSGATLLAQMRTMTGSFEAQGFSWWNAFVGLERGSMGETSALACLIGAVIIIATGVGSWRTMAAATLGTVLMASLLNVVGSATNPWFGVPFWWHMVLGGWAFGIVFMATDPVTSTFSEAGKWVYGAMMGALIVLIRVVNPAYPESVMLVILFMNVMAPIIDHFFVQANVRRRKARRG